MENLYPPPVPQIKDGKIARFDLCAASSLIWRGGGVGGLLFHFIMSKIVDCLSFLCKKGAQHTVMESSTYQTCWMSSVTPALTMLLH